MLISCSGHQPQKLHTEGQAINMPSLGITWAQQHRECIDEGRDGFCHVPGKKQKCCLRQIIHRAKWKKPFALAPCPGRFVGSITLVWISAVTVRTEAVSNNSSCAPWGGFLPPKHREQGWKNRLQLNVAGAVHFAGIVEGVCWVGTLSSKQLGEGCP